MMSHQAGTTGQMSLGQAGHVSHQVPHEAGQVAGHVSQQAPQAAGVTAGWAAQMSQQAAHVSQGPLQLLAGQ